MSERDQGIHHAPSIAEAEVFFTSYLQGNPNFSLPEARSVYQSAIRSIIQKERKSFYPDIVGYWKQNAKLVAPAVAMELDPETGENGISALWIEQHKDSVVGKNVAEKVSEIHADPQFIIDFTDIRPHLFIDAPDQTEKILSTATLLGQLGYHVDVTPDGDIFYKKEELRS